MTLPAGWAEPCFAEIARQRSGNGKLIKGKLLSEPVQGSFPAFSASGQDVWRDDYEYEGDAIIVSAVGARCGKAFRASGRWSAIANTHVVVPEHDAVDTDFLFRILNDEAFWVKGGTAQPFVKVGATFEKSVPLPPLAEQRRIIAKLDEVNARLARARAELDRVITLAGKLRRSVHRPIGEVREAQNVSSLASVISKLRTGPFGSSVHKHDYIVGGTPLINPMHIKNGRIVPSFEVSVGSAKSAELSDFKLAAGNVIIGRRGEMGRCAVVQEDQAGWLIGTGSMALTPNEAVSSEYLQLFLSSPPTVEALNANSVGSTMVNLNQSILLALPIRLPNRAEQDRLVTEARSAFARADRLETEAVRARALLDRLESALLAKALRGELVSQDPNDEPAQTLLDRIRTQRAAAPKVKRGRRKAQSEPTNA